MNATEASASPLQVRPRRPARSAFFVAITLSMIAVAIAGFWPQYYGRLLSGTEIEVRTSHPLIHIHSVLFVGWLLMLLGQTILVWRRRTDLHLWLGPFLIAYGLAIAAFGTFAGLVLAARRVELGRPLDAAASFAFVTTSDMLMFAGFLIAAWVWRKRPEAHKRLMILATWSLAVVGYGRLLGRVLERPDNFVVAALFIVAPLILVVAWDAIRIRRVHPAWIIGVILYFLRAVRAPFANSELWLPIGRALVDPFL